MFKRIYLLTIIFCAASIEKADLAGNTVRFPSDGIKTAKDISNTLQKLFAEYQKMYDENYQQIKNILADLNHLVRASTHSR